MDARAAKLALARKKLKDHQDKKVVVQNNESSNVPMPTEVEQKEQTHNEIVSSCGVSSVFGDNEQNIQNVPTVVESHSESILRPNFQFKDRDVNVTEILISNKTNLEIQINDLQTKLLQLEYNQSMLINDNKNLKQHISNLQSQLKNVNDKYLQACEENIIHKQTIADLNTLKSSFSDENSNLQEQLEFTRSILSAKEIENSSLKNQLSNLQCQLDVTQLQVQQLTNGLNSTAQSQKQNDNTPNAEVLLQKISSLEHALKSLQKEKDHMSIHYEQYASELNEQLKLVVSKNQDMAKEIQILSNRENSLIEQISDMEIRLQNYHRNNEYVQEEIKNEANYKKLLEDYENMKAKYEELCTSYDDVHRKYIESENRAAQLNDAKESQLANESIISMTKLNADIASDKVAVQRATEQNKKLKLDLQELEEAFVKISRDKLELTEKLDAEKFLNRELTLKLADVDEKAKDTYTKLIAKDDEMIRLQSNLSEINAQYEKLTKQVQENVVQHETKKNEQEGDIETTTNNEDVGNEKDNLINCTDTNHNCSGDVTEQSNTKIPKEDAMSKLQERFLKIMGEVADLSDEKHRLEHIIFQLQHETDTICEYVALYQEQRNLLKKRDLERSAQIKIFQSNCELLHNQLEELTAILIKLTTDNELAAYLQVENRRGDVLKIMDLLTNLKNNSLIDPNRKCSSMKDFYPCSCCSGTLIDV